jgi:hypothetical protein
MSGTVTNNKRTIKIASALGCLTTCCSLTLAALALVPAFWAMFSQRTVSQMLSGDYVRLDIYDSYGTSISLLPETPQAEIDTRNLEPLSFSKGNIIGISVTNTSDQTVIISNQLPIKMILYQPLEEPINVYLPPIGGPGYYRQFVVAIPNTAAIGKVLARFEEVVLDDEQLIQDKPDFFTLVPSETEVFTIEFKFNVPGRYEFIPGVEYTVNGEKHELYLSKKIRTSMPKRIVVWGDSAPGSSSLYILEFQCDYSDNPENQSAHNIFNISYNCTNE